MEYLPVLGSEGNQTGSEINQKVVSIPEIPVFGGYIFHRRLREMRGDQRTTPRRTRARRHAVRPPFMPSLSLTCVQAEAAARGGARSLRLFAVKRSVFLESQCSGQHLLLLRPCAPGSCSRHCQPCQSKLWSTCRAGYHQG